MRVSEYVRLHVQAAIAEMNDVHGMISRWLDNASGPNARSCTPDTLVHRMEFEYLP